MADLWDIIDPTGVGRRGANVIRGRGPAAVGARYIPGVGNLLRGLDVATQSPGYRSRPNTKLKSPGASGIQRATQPSMGASNPLGELYEQLLQSLTGGVGVDEAGLMAQIRAQYDPVYDARRSAIEQGMERTEGRAQEGRADIKNMYGELAKEYKNIAGEQRGEAKETQSQIEDLYGELRSNIEGNYSRISEEQADEFKQLGIEAASEDVMQPQEENALAAMNRADERGAQEQQRYIDIGDIDQTYYREGAPLARLTGANRGSELMEQLQDYLAEQEMGLQTLEAERTSGIQQAYNQLLAQAQGQAASQQSQQQSMLWNILQSQLEAQGQQGEELNAESYMRALPQELQQQVGAAFRSIERSDAVQTGQVPGRVGGTYTSTPDAYWLEAAEEMYSNGQISDATYSALTSYIRLALGLPGLGLG